MRSMLRPARARGPNRLAGVPEALAGQGGGMSAWCRAGFEAKAPWCCPEALAASVRARRCLDPSWRGSA